MSKRAKTNDASDRSKRAKANDATNCDYAGYAARAGAAITDTEIGDLIRTITSCPGNAEILRRLKNDDPSLTRLDLCNFKPFPLSPCEYSAEGCSLGWLGHFVGESTHLTMLSLDEISGINRANVGRDELLAFLRGLNQNRSVQHLRILHLCRLSAELPALSRFFAENKNLVSLEVSSDSEDLDRSIAHQLSQTLRSCSSLKSFEFEVDEFQEHEDEHVVEIINSLSEKSNLQEVRFPGCLGQGGHRALADLLAWEGSQLQSLDIENSDMDVEDFECLLDAVASNEKLQNLNMSDCHGRDNDDQASFDLSSAWGSVERPLLKAFALNLVELNITRLSWLGGSIDDDGAIAFSRALVGNKKLKVLKANWCRLTSRGWNAVSNLLCNTSSPIATYASNHTLQNLGLGVKARDVTAVDSAFRKQLVSLLSLNRNDDKALVASAKILKSHGDFHMQIFFEWEFKMLPIAVQWLERAAVPVVSNPPIDPNIQRRKLLMLYQFVRGAPKLFVEHRLRGELEEIQAKKERVRMEQERMRQELEWLEERERVIHNNLRGE